MEEVKINDAQFTAGSDDAVLIGDDGLPRARRLLQSAVDEVAAAWNGLAPDRRPHLDSDEDRRLEEAITVAFRSGDPQAAMQAVAEWRSAWERLLQAPKPETRPAPRVRRWLDLVEEAIAKHRKTERPPKRKAPVPDGPTAIGPAGNRVDLQLTEAEHRRVDQGWVNRMLVKLAEWDREQAEEAARKQREAQMDVDGADSPGGSPLVDGNTILPPDQPPPAAGPQPVQEGPR